MGDSIIGKPSHMAQYITALAATMGALSMGAILGYSSPAGSQLKGPDLPPNVTLNVSNIDCPLIHDEPLTDNQISWFGSTVNIGALIGAPLGGVCINLIGRRTTMVATIAPFLLGWFLIEFANNFAMLVAGRIFCGICCGLVSLSVPTYIGEIASPDIRGLLGTGFQLMVVIGILYVYSLGAGLCWQWIALLCLIPAVVFCVAMFFSKESPVFLLSKNKSQEAKEALQFFRGEHYNIEPELQQLTQSIEEAQRNKASFRDLKTPYILKPLLISLALMFFQQTSGINAILFNLNEIFKSAHVELGEDASSIIIAAVQVVATCLGAVLMDRAGRKLLLILSAGAMCISLVGMGAYFFVSEQDLENHTTNADSLGWLPLLSMIIFITFFSIGFGPIPWLMMGELFSAEVRELASTLATLTNWLLSFIVTLVFQPLIDAINNSGVYWLFAIFCACSFVFSLLVVKETKGKTIEEITFMFGGPPPNAGGNVAPSIPVVVVVNAAPNVSPPSGEDERKRSTASSSSSSASEGADNKGFVA
ncbi:facilitated trehalose transporter Tret1 isoform X2 [Hyalella azteca]|nr:facilitated trehalose transporter Tret1 isoform X2 [Hyalella azteca]XP_018012770.1 facilitated trehalose transporter Tret1 isoform X2 [Hyalella azteca]XP_018012771.1 facilitated trehalose transporter Tret1 isoform X2 [Hyalella azteca]